MTNINSEDEIKLLVNEENREKIPIMIQILFKTK
jgi:hypothetical protein